ncbi:hypothetical protein [Streptomyces rhizosphaerihabitans]|uniref:hypothetical protein n=1 Tax=Streptomyces rhizosphaerihabitans TaxID=1266770 RepID=UPI0021C24FB5|nr:hypothetical protein [Streptomyces rhizosphaerihabitans]MCT9008984.1 hypothetical protein [Streptomyces rhizosphaerihabitans]
MRREAHEGFVTGVTEVIDSFGVFARALSNGGREAARAETVRKLDDLLSLGNSPSSTAHCASVGSPRATR